MAIDGRPIASDRSCQWGGPRIRIASLGPDARPAPTPSRHPELLALRMIRAGQRRRVGAQLPFRWASTQTLNERRGDGMAGMPRLHPRYSGAPGLVPSHRRLQCPE